VQSRPSRLSAHIHVDAPLHFLVDGREMAAMPVDQWVGEAAVVDLTHLDANGEVTAEDLKRRAEHVRPGDIVLLRTDWPKRVSVETEQFWKDGPWTGLSACEWLVARQVKAVGYDYPPGPVHPRHDRRAAIFFPAGITVIEYLTNLDQIGVSRCRFVALPLKLEGADGCPVRAIAIVESPAPS